MSFDFNLLKDIFGFFEEIIDRVTSFIGDRKEEKQKRFQEWYSEILAIRAALYEINPFAVSFGSDPKDAVNTYYMLQRLIDKYAWIQQSTLNRAKTMSSFFQQCREAMDYMHSVYEGEKPYQEKDFRKNYVNTYCNFDIELSFVMGLLDDPPSFKTSKHSDLV